MTTTENLVQHDLKLHINPDGTKVRVPASTRIGEGVFIYSKSPGDTEEDSVKIGQYVKLGDNVTVMRGVEIGDNNHIGNDVVFGVNSSIGNGNSIGYKTKFEYDSHLGNHNEVGRRVYFFAGTNQRDNATYRDDERVMSGGRYMKRW